MLPRVYGLVVLWLPVSVGVLLFINGCTSLSEAFKPKAYPCVIGCGNEGFTPDKGYYYDPNVPGKQRPLSEFYKKNGYEL